MLALSAFSTAGCATAPSRGDPMQAALTQPLRDLSVLRVEAAPALVRAAAQPYVALRDCSAIRSELDELDGLLGPDDDGAVPRRDGVSLAAAVVAGAASLPLRPLVRRLSGAQQRDEAVAAVYLGAAVRRGFLRGEAAGMRCPFSGSEPQAPLR